MKINEILSNAYVQELIFELSECDIKELHVIREEWEIKMRKQNIPERVILLCKELTDLVIEKKEEKERATI